MLKDTTQKAFTVSYDQIRNRLVSTVELSSGDRHVNVKALWDTGATASCVSHDVVSQLKLIAYSKQQIQTPSGSDQVNVHLVDVMLPNHVSIPSLRVCDSEIGNQGIGMLIGMDVISMGDFSVSNFNGKTIFTFRIPSQKETDYVKQLQLQNAIGQRHGPGKRKRR